MIDWMKKEKIVGVKSEMFLKNNNEEAKEIAEVRGSESDRQHSEED